MPFETWGALEAKVDWQTQQMSCEGMRGPSGEGARLRFAGQIGTASERQNVAVIFSIPDLAGGGTGEELRTRVTIIEEDAGRCFSTQDAGVCWSNINRQDPRSDYRGVTMSGHYEIEGLLDCVAPVAELHGAASVTLSDVKFRGSLSWTEK